MAINPTTATGHSMHDAATINDDAALQSPAAQAHHSPARVTKKEVDVHGTLHAGGPQRANEAMLNTIEEHKAAARREAQDEELAPPPPPKANPEATTTGYAASADPLAELKNDPEYQRLQEEEALLKELNDGGFTFLENKYGWDLGVVSGRGDGKLTWSDVDSGEKDADALAAALKKHSAMFKEMAGSMGGDLTIDMVCERLAGVQGRLHDMEVAAKAAASTAGGAGAPVSGGTHASVASPGTPPPPAQSTPAAGSTNTTAQASTANNTSGAAGTSKPKHTAAELDAMTNPPEDFKPTSKTAEGKTSETYEYLDKWSESLESKLDDAIANGDEALSQKLQRKLAKLELCKQMIMNLQKQQMETASTMAKLYSDMAMTAIHNLR